MNAIIKIAAIAASTIMISACGGSSNNDSEPESVFEFVEDSSNFETLETALKATGLDTTLSDTTSDYTLFAPTDAAFEKLGQDAINALLADTDTLSDILLYHVLGSEVNAAGAIAAAGTKVETANNDSVSLSLSGTTLYINLSEVTITDRMTGNGIVHVIDTVLTPPPVAETPTNNIVGTATAAGNFTTLLAALDATDLDIALADETATYTVFAPTDAAFDLLPTGVLTALLDDTTALTALLQQHVIAGAAVDSYTAFTLNGMTAETLSGANVGIDIIDGVLTVGGAAVSVTDITTTNGIIHVIDAVIVGDLDVPSPSIIDVATELGNFTTLITALEATGLDATLADLESTFTVFAPTDDAFAKLGMDTINNLLADTDTLTSILTYHVIGDSSIASAAAIDVANSDMSKVETVNGADVALSLNGSDLFINLSQVVTADVMASNGVIHALDTVLSIPEMHGAPTLNIPETAMNAGSFTTLLTALGVAGLDTTLSDPNETFTVFAPTDAAFALIPEATLTALLADVPALTDVLLQHVIIGAEVDSLTAFTLNGTSVNTAANEDVTIEIVENMLEIQGSKISTFDIFTTNGVIHVIDAVITETLQ